MRHSCGIRCRSRRPLLCLRLPFWPNGWTAAWGIPVRWLWGCWRLCWVGSGGSLLQKVIRSETCGRLMWLEMLPVLLVAAGPDAQWALVEPTRLVAVAGQFCGGAGGGLGDRWVFEATHQLISGHAVRHLALAACCGWVAYRLGRSAFAPSLFGRPDGAAGAARAPALCQTIRCLSWRPDQARRTSLPVSRLANWAASRLPAADRQLRVGANAGGEDRAVMH